MAITHDSNGIIVTGTETFDAVVAYHDTNTLGLLTTSNRVATLGTNCRIWAKDGALLTAEKWGFVFNATTATMQSVGTGSSTIQFNDCVLHFAPKTYALGQSARGNYLDWSWSDETTSATQSTINTARKINLTNSQIIYLRTGEAVPGDDSLSTQIFLSDLINVNTSSYRLSAAANSPTNENGVELYLQSGATVENLQLQQIFRISILGSASVKGITANDCRDSFLMATPTTGTTLILDDATLTNPALVLGAIFPASNGVFQYRNPVSMPTFGTTAPDYFYITAGSRVEKTLSVRLDFDLQSVKVAYKNSDHTYLDTSDAGGLAELDLIIERGFRSGSDEGFTNASATYGPWDFAWRLYGYRGVLGAGVTIDSAIGRPEQYRAAQLLIDPVIQANLATASAYTGVAVNHSTNTVTISGSRTVRQIYDYIHFDLYQDANLYEPDHLTSGDGLNFTSSYNWTINSAALITSTPKAVITWAASTTVVLGADGDYSIGFAGVIPATGEVQVTDGTSNLAGWAFAAGAEINLRSGQTAATVQVDQPQIANITAGAGVTLVSSPVEFTGFPTGNNANGVAYAAVIAILNTDDDVLLAEYTGGATYSVSLSEVGNGVGPFEVWGDGVGLRRTIAQTITATRTDPVSLAGLFEEFISEDGTALIGLAAADSDVVYVALDTNFEFDGPTHSFLGIVHQFDLLTSTPAGQDFDNAAVRGIEFVSNDAYRRIFLPSPFTISASATATGIPVITDCLILRTTTLADVRVTPIVQFAFQAEGAGSGLTPQQVRDSLKLAPSAGAAATDSIDDKIDGISVGSSSGFTGLI